MSGKHAFGKAPGLEQGKAQQHRIAHARPDRSAHVPASADVLYQDGVNRYADHNQKRLETESKQRPKIALAHAAPLLAHHCRHRDGGYAGDEVNLDHSAKSDNEDADGECPHGNAHKEGLDPQTQQRPQVHCLQLRFQVGDDVGKVDAGTAHDHPGGSVDNALGQIKHTHDDVPGIGDDQDSAGGLEYPLEEHPGVHVIEVVALGEHLYQFQCHHNGEDDTGNGENDGVGKVSHHIEDTAVPRLGGQAHLGGDVRHLLVYTVKKPGEVAEDTAD